MTLSVHSGGSGDSGGNHCTGDVVRRRGGVVIVVGVGVGEISLGILHEAWGLVGSCQATRCDEARGSGCEGSLLMLQLNSWKLNTVKGGIQTNQTNINLSNLPSGGLPTTRPVGKILNSPPSFSGK